MASSSSSSSDDLPTYLSIVSDTKNKTKMSSLIRKGRESIKSDPNWVNRILSSNDCNKYIYLLVKNFIKDGSAIVYGDSILPSDSSDKGILMNQFIRYVTQESKKSINRIYAMINSPSESRDISHQNWICLEFKNGSFENLTRFEPSNWYEEEFRIQSTCIEIIRTLFSSFRDLSDDDVSSFITTDEKAFGLNKISGCRLFSTILASLHVTGIPLSNLTSLIKWKNRKCTQQNSFGYEVNNQIKEYIEDKIDDRPARRLSRSANHSFSFITKKSKSARKTPAKKKSKKKSVRKSKKTPKKSKK